MPHGLVGPVILAVRAVNDRIERRIKLFACEDVFGFLMLLITNTVRVGTRCRDEEVQRLGASITRTFGHDVEQGAARLGVQFVEDNAGDVEPVLRIRLSREDLVEAVGWFVDDQPRTHTLRRALHHHRTSAAARPQRRAPTCPSSSVSRRRRW